HVAVTRLARCAPAGQVPPGQLAPRRGGQLRVLGQILPIQRDRPGSAVFGHWERVAPPGRAADVDRPGRFAPARMPPADPHPLWPATWRRLVGRYTTVWQGHGLTSAMRAVRRCRPRRDGPDGRFRGARPGPAGMPGTPVGAARGAHATPPPPSLPRASAP